MTKPHDRLPPPTKPTVALRWARDQLIKVDDILEREVCGHLDKIAFIKLTTSRDHLASALVIVDDLLRLHTPCDDGHG